MTEPLTVNRFLIRPQNSESLGLQCRVKANVMSDSDCESVIELSCSNSKILFIYFYNEVAMLCAFKSNCKVNTRDNNIPFHGQQQSSTITEVSKVETF